MKFIKVFFKVLFNIFKTLYKKFMNQNIIVRYQECTILLIGLFTLVAYQAYGIYEKAMAWQKETIITLDKNKALQEEVKSLKITVAKQAQDKAATTQKAELKKNTLSRKNNNPMNVKACGQKWQGGMGTDKHDHVVFQNYEYSIRAGAKVLFKYMEEHKIGTINGIVRRYSTNNHKAYAQYLSDHMNLGKDEEFNIVKRLPELLQYMSEFETGEKISRKYFVAYDVASQIEANRQAKIAKLTKENNELKKQLKAIKEKKTEVASK